MTKKSKAVMTTGCGVVDCWRDSLPFLPRAVATVESTDLLGDVGAQPNGVTAPVLGA